MAELRAGWEVTSSAPGAWDCPKDILGATWVGATVPGTAAAAVGPGDRNFDDEDWFFRTRFSAVEIASGEPGQDSGGPALASTGFELEFDGIATVSQVFLNGELILESASMWETHTVDVSERLLPDNELVIACRALSPLMAVAKRPRQRWRTRLVHEGNLRWYRTMIFGRSPGYAPSPAPVGPWRPVRLVRKPTSGIGELRVTPRLDGEDGVVAIRARTFGSFADAEAVIGDVTTKLTAGADGWLQGEVRLAGVEPWWPHTHGNSRLYELTIELDGIEAARRRVGFRSLTFAQDISADGLDLHVNGVPVFARGAVWTPMDLISLAPPDADLRRVLERARDAGMNMLRVVGTGAYESPQFFDLCDELGILIWQDLMFASLDYPLSDPDFRAEIEREARQVLVSLSGRPSLAVLCASHELEQQPAMLGLDPTLGRDQIWEETLPALLAEYGPDCAYLRSTPIGGDVPFHADTGIAHYFGVGGYFQPLNDVRSAGVRFAAECLPFANVPDSVELPTHHPDWKAGVQRDAGPAFQLAPGFDFDDVRDFYLAELFDVDPVKLRRTDQERYVQLSKVASGEAMAEVIGEWRRASSSCRGALVLWMKDMVPGAGFGLLDHRGLPKLAYHHLRRAFAPVAVWTTDERLSGTRIHVANDRSEPLQTRLRVALYSELRSLVAEAEEVLELGPHTMLERTVEGMLGRFVDSAAVFGFGPPAHDAIVVSLESADDEHRLISQSVRFPAGRPLARTAAERMDVSTDVHVRPDGDVDVVVRSDSLLYEVTLDIPGFEAEDSGFCVEPRVSRIVRLRSTGNQPALVGGLLRAVNMMDALAVAAPASDQTTGAPSAAVGAAGEANSLNTESTQART